MLAASCIKEASFSPQEDVLRLPSRFRIIEAHSADSGEQVLREQYYALRQKVYVEKLGFLQDSDLDQFDPIATIIVEVCPEQQVVIAGCRIIKLADCASLPMQSYLVPGTDLEENACEISRMTSVHCGSMRWFFPFYGVLLRYFRFEGLQPYMIMRHTYLEKLQNYPCNVSETFQRLPGRSMKKMIRQTRECLFTPVRLDIDRGSQGLKQYLNRDLRLVK